MRVEKKQNSLRLPMLEIIIILGTFLVISVLIMKMFLATERMRIRAENISRAVLEAESIAEFIKGREVTNKLFDELSATKLELTENTYLIHYDKKWNDVVNESNQIIVIEYIEEQRNFGGMDTFYVTAYESDYDKVLAENIKPLCKLVIKKMK